MLVEFGATSVDFSCPAGCAWLEDELEIHDSVDRPAGSVPCSVILPARNEKDIYNTIEDYLAAGAVEIVVVDDGSDTPVAYCHERVLVLRNDKPKGPAFSRNRGARAATQPVIVFSDAHVRFDGDLRVFVDRAARGDCVLCATCAALDSGCIVGYGAHWSWRSKYGCYMVVWNRLRPEDRYSAITCLCGSVYAMTKDAYNAFGGWPDTLSAGYNEAAINLAITFAGIPMLVDRDTVARHEFRTTKPYAFRGRDQLLNRGLVLYQLFAPAMYRKLSRTLPLRTRRYVDRHKVGFEAHRRMYQAKRVRTDEDVLAIQRADTPMRVAGIMALAPVLFPLWRRCLSSLAAQCDRLYLRVDMHHLGDTTIEEIREASGPRLAGLIASWEPWNRWNWREDLLRMLDRAGCNVVLFPDQDEEFPEGFADDLAAFYRSPLDAMMFDYECPTADAATVEIHPKQPHMKAYRWQPGLTYENYKGFARVTNYARGRMWQAAHKIRHLCFYTADLRAEKVCH